MRTPKPRQYTDPKKPKVKYIVEHYAGGKRSRRFFESKSAATHFCQDIDNDRKTMGFEDAGILTDGAKRQAAEAIRRLAEVRATLPEAVDYYMKHLAARKQSKEIGEAVEEWLSIRRKDGSRPRTIRNLEGRSSRLTAKFTGRLVAEITHGELISWLEGIEGGDQTKKHYRAVAGAFFNWARLKEYCPVSPVDLIPIPDVKNSDPGLFTPKQMTTMLKDAKDPQLVAWLVLCGFAGLRSEEAERLDWSDIDFEHRSIDIRPEVSKTGKGRDIDLEEHAAEWLQGIAKKSGRILLDRWLDKQKVRDFKGELKFPWVQNGLRHSYGTYHLYRGMDAGKTAMMMGHQGNPQMLFQHYRRRVKSDIAKAWFEIRPEKGKGKIIKMRAEA